VSPEKEVAAPEASVHASPVKEDAPMEEAVAVEASAHEPSPQATQQVV